MMPIILPLVTLIILNSWSCSILTLPILMVMMSLKLYNPAGVFVSYASPYMTTDTMSVVLIMLTLWITMLMLISSMKIKEEKMMEHKFHATVMVLCLILVLAFSMNNMFTYYLFFEASLIPTLLLILMWGYQPERLRAGMYLMLYTITASLPLLLGITLLFMKFHSVHFYILYPPMEMNHFLNISLVMAFLVKMPIYTFHLWLPKAHVEAPVAGSMILASVLLKLGAYGLLRMAFMHPQVLETGKSLIMSISLWGAVLTAISCIRQLDMKAMIAYASVSHMALAIAGIYSNSIWGWEGTLAMMIAHGLSSSGLFALANMYYENTNTRSLFITKGLLFICPSMAMWWFLMIAANMAAPPTINLLSEIMLIMAILFYSHMALGLVLLTSFFTVCYSLILYISMHHGPPSEHLHFINVRQIYFTISFLHAAPLYSLILAPDFITSWL